MTLHTLPTGYEPSGYDEHAEMISQARGQVLAELAADLQALDRAGAGVAELRIGGSGRRADDGQTARSLRILRRRIRQTGPPRPHARRRRPGPPLSAPAQRRTPLQLVPDPAAATDDSEWLTGDSAAIADPTAEEPESWQQAQTVLNQWAPEHQLIGALIRLTADQARPILSSSPTPRSGSRCDSGHTSSSVPWSPTAATPTPLSSWPRPASGDGAWASTPEPSRPRPYRLTGSPYYLAAAYTQVLSPQAAAGDYAREVLDEAYRRAFRNNGIRMQQLGRVRRRALVDPTD